MNDAPLMEAYAELRSLAEDAPPTVKEALFGLSARQTELFCTVPVGDGTLRVEPSRFLNQVIDRLKGRDWAGVLFAVRG